MGDVKFLEKLNLALLDFEDRTRPKPKELHKFYFVIGAPRAGTTIATQLLALRYAYITNIAARFWMTPVVGLTLSEQIMGEYPNPGMHSKYARTLSPENIHEFGKFWQCHLGFKNAQDVKSFVQAGYFEITKKALQAISQHFKRPVVMKGIYPAYVHEFIDIMLGADNVVWYNVERDPLDCCESILRARNNKKWFGWYPPQELYERLIDFQPKVQIAYQVAYFRRFYHSIATETVSLKELCDEHKLTLRIYERARREWEGVYAEAEENVGLSSTKLSALDGILSQNGPGGCVCADGRCAGAEGEELCQSDADQDS